jgi:hypothetical protein
MGQVAAGVVAPTAIYHALGRGRIAGTKQHGGWTFTPQPDLAVALLPHGALDVVGMDEPLE